MVERAKPQMCLPPHLTKLLKNEKKVKIVRKKKISKNNSVFSNSVQYSKPILEISGTSVDCSSKIITQFELLSRNLILLLIDSSFLTIFDLQRQI
jgi:uncharacterized metal-binding protein